MVINILGSTRTTAFAFGSLLHILVLKNIELDVYIPHFLIISLASFAAFCFAQISTGDVQLLTAIWNVTSLAICLGVGVVTSMIIYRLFFHRIRRFPGPILARISRFYAFHLSGKNVQYHVELSKLHKEYGDFVRTGPREICVVRKSAVSLILGATSPCLKSTWYSQVSRNDDGAQIFFSRDPAHHKRRRKAWDRGFSVKALSTYQPRIKSKVDLLISELQKTSGDPIDVTAWTMMLAFDIMGEIGYGKDFGGIVTGKEHPAARAIHDHMTILGTVGMTPWLLYMIQFIPGASAGYAPFFKWCANMIAEKRSGWDPEKYPQDISSWLIKAFVERDVSASPTEASLNDDGRLIIIAGSDTSASANAHTLYFLAQNPHVLRKLQSKLDDAMPNGAQDWDYEKVLTISYVDDVILESMRLKPPVLTGGYRVTPAEGLQIDEVYIPGDVNVFVPFQVIQTDERYWPQPLEFIPERWGERSEEMGTDDSLLIPFSAGVYKCPGDKLAMMSMRTAISSIVQQFDISFAPGETGEQFDTGAKDAFTTVLSPLNLVFTPRKV